MEIVEFEPGEIRAFMSRLQVYEREILALAFKALEEEIWIPENEQKRFRLIDEDIWCLRLGPNLWQSKRDLGVETSKPQRQIAMLLRVYLIFENSRRILILGAVDKSDQRSSLSQREVLTTVRKRRDALKNVEL
jgi:hypothetical protein